MSKVFLSCAPEFKPINITSRDYYLTSNYTFPLTCMIDKYTEKGDSVRAVIYFPNGDSFFDRLYEFLKMELEGLARNKTLALDISWVIQNEYPENKYNSLQNNILLDSFKEIQAKIQDGDRVFIDATFGNKAHVLDLFAAAYYCVRTAVDVKIEDMFMGILKDESIEIVSQNVLCDLTVLAGNMEQGTREMLDELLLKNTEGMLLEDENTDSDTQVNADNSVPEE